MSSSNTFLWKISGPYSAADSYLFGTMHVQDIRAFSNLEKVLSFIEKCESFAVEFHLEEAANLAAHMPMQIPESQKLSDLIHPKKYKKLRSILLKSVGLDIQYFERTLPFMITGLVSNQILHKDMPESLDEHLWIYARGQGKELLGIETLDEQIAVMASIPLEVQVKMLLELGRNIGKFRKQILKTTNLYQQGEMLRLSKSVKRNARGLRKIMLYHRNEIMAERIADMVKEKTLFAAIGAGHLGGGKGVIRLLKKRGLSLSPVL